MSSEPHIELSGVRQNNLKNIDLKIPIGKMVVVCGPSGSGKSSLAFETLFAEGQRRFIESLSSYSKQFIIKPPKPELDQILNVPPAIALQQKNSVRNSRSTVGTATELAEYLRLIFEKVAKPVCPVHQTECLSFSAAQAAQELVTNWQGRRGYLLVESPKFDTSADKKNYIQALIGQGFIRGGLLVKGKKDLEVLNLEKDLKKLSGLKKNFFVITDRLSFSPEEEGRLIDSLRVSFDLARKTLEGPSLIRVYALSTDGHWQKFSDSPQCPLCDFSPPKLQASQLNFNSPMGACPTCKGFGNILQLDPKKVVPNPDRTLDTGALEPFEMPSARAERRKLFDFCKRNKIPLDVPWAELDPEQQEKIWRGGKGFVGVVGLFELLEEIKYKMHVRVFISRYRSPKVCPDCQGSRLRPEAFAYLIGGESYPSLCKKTIGDIFEFISTHNWSPEDLLKIKEPYQQLRKRLEYLKEVGLDYISLDRETKTLSGGEYQRVMLANQLGAQLSQTLYVLDEPTIGLHPRDNRKLIGVLKKIKELGNSLVVVEHDQEVIEAADYVIEMGPESGYRGGEVVFTGSHDEFLRNEKSLTASYLRLGGHHQLLQKLAIPRPVRLESYKYFIELKGCRGHNLKGVDLELPLNRFVVVTGVSGSGKTTLIKNTLYPALVQKLRQEYLPQEPFDSIEGFEALRAVVMVSQESLGRSVRSSPATVLKIFDSIREILASQPVAKERGYTAGTFSLNIDGGRCPHCKGTGVEQVDMIFLDDVQVPCEVCDGKLYQEEILEISFQGKNIYEILQMTVLEAREFFVNYPNIRARLNFLVEVGLSYLRLGQSTSSLSGGEAQRLKIAKELLLSSVKNHLYIFDEPTTGLHFKEIGLLLKMLHRLIEEGASVLVIEHNQEVILQADYVIDLGPGSGHLGGEIVATGTPHEIMTHPKSLTGYYLKQRVSS